MDPSPSDNNKAPSTPVPPSIESRTEAPKTPVSEAKSSLSDLKSPIAEAERLIDAKTPKSSIDDTIRPISEEPAKRQVAPPPPKIYLSKITTAPLVNKGEIVGGVRDIH